MLSRKAARLFEICPGKATSNASKPLCSSSTATHQKWANVFVEGGDIIPDSNVNSQPYSGSFTYELSFLDKSHTLIADINKENSLPNGIGEKGFVIIPQQLDKRVKLNIDYYLSKAGLIDETFTKIINT